MDSASVLVFLIVAAVPLGTCKEKFTLESDGPAILDSEITFYATMKNIQHETYTIAWQENFPNNRTFMTTLDKSNDFKSKWTLRYGEKTTRPGIYSITVIVNYQILVWNFPVASVLYNYNITNTFPGELNISQPRVPKRDPSYVSTRNETELVARVHDPSNLLSRAENVTYVWSRNNTIVGTTIVPSIRMNFTKEGVYPITVDFRALFNTTGFVGYKNGSFSTNVTAKDPIVNFTLAGATWFRHGKLLQLDISCDGTAPYTYCWMIRTGPYNRTGNESCISPSVTNDCDIPIQRYFIESGIYSLLIIMENDVSRMVNQTTINVYKVTRKPQISIIVVPLTCSILAIVVIIFGVAYYWENHARYTVEVADFDFGPQEEAPYVGFWERLRDAVSAATLRGRRGRPLIPDNSSTVTSDQDQGLDD